MNSENNEKNGDTDGVPTSPPFVTAREAAEYLRVTEGCLSEWRRRKTGPRYYQPGGANSKVLYRMEDLMEWVESGAADHVDDVDNEPAADTKIDDASVER